MPHYQVTLNGKNFWLSLDEKPMKFGFFTSRLVESANEEQAELDAVQLIRKDPGLQGVLNERSDPPMIYCKEIIEIEPFDATMIQAGFTFYPEDEEES